MQLKKEAPGMSGYLNANSCGAKKQYAGHERKHETSTKSEPILPPACRSAATGYTLHAFTPGILRSDAERDLLCVPIVHS